MFEKLILTNFTQEDLSDALWERLGRAAREVKIVRRTEDEAAFRQEVSSADGIILRLGMGADSSFQDATPNLRYIGMFGTGYGRIDTEHAKSRGIVVTNVADYSTQSVAELVVGMSLRVLRNLCEEEEHAASSAMDWKNADTTFVGRDLGALTVGVVGAGFIGRRVIQIMAQGFGARVLYSSRQPKSELNDLDGVQHMSIEDVLATSDLITLHLAANADTEHILDASRIDAIRSGGILVNTAPNELLDLDAVIRRCADGTLTFAMDHADELDASSRSKLLGTPNVHVYPPIGYATAEAAARKCEVLVSNVESFLAGNPHNHVNP
jgi:lactate dehydrogenase-like 2-hydroxyacid dehydrogenase